MVGRVVLDYWLFAKAWFCSQGRAGFTSFTRRTCQNPLEPDKASLCWFSSTYLQQNKKGSNKSYFLFYGGQGWIRTTVVSRRQIYSLLPLATRAPTLRLLYSVFNFSFGLSCRHSDWRIVVRLVLEKRYLIFFLRS